MCGIAGLVGRCENARAHVQRMIDALSHRGPDDEGIYESAEATLGHRRLSIIDLTGGHQPIVDEASGLSITFNGENDDTKYETGNEFHLEAAAAIHFSPTFSVGVNGYHYEQLTGDSGAGAALGDFEGRVTAFGPTMSATFVLGPIPVITSLRYFREFNVKNRLEGNAGWLTITIPLWAPDQGG